MGDAMEEGLQNTADELLVAALEREGARDPREYYRERLRDLKGESAQGYEEAVRFYRDKLVPAIAKDGTEPLTAWREYGRTIMELLAPGRTVTIDTSGRSATYESDISREDLVLHLPDTKNIRALVVALPTTLSPAQSATFDLLVAGRQKLREDFGDE